MNDLVKVLMKDLNTPVIAAVADALERAAKLLRAQTDSVTDDSQNTKRKPGRPKKVTTGTKKRGRPRKNVVPDPVESVDNVKVENNKENGANLTF